MRPPVRQRSVIRMPLSLLRSLKMMRATESIIFTLIFNLLIIKNRYFFVAIFSLKHLKNFFKVI